MTLTDNRFRTITQTATVDTVVSTVDYMEVGLEDKGTYTCHARNANQALQHMFEVAVKGEWAQFAGLGRTRWPVTSS